MHINKIALSILIFANCTMIDASAPKITKTFSSKLLGATKAAGIFGLGAFTIETFRCVYLAKGDPEISSKMFLADTAAISQNAEKLAKTIIAALPKEASKGYIEIAKDASKK